jgi:hypothetical protein
VSKRLPKIFLDTSICVDVGRGNISFAEWEIVRRFIANRFTYAISPLTLSEILVGIARGDDAHFESNRGALRILCPFAEAEFLRMPGHFALERVLHDRRKAEGLEPEDFRKQARITLRAKDKLTLLSGGVLLPEVKTHSHGMDLQHEIGFMQAGRKDHIRGLQKLREGKLRRTCAITWAQTFLAQFGKTATVEEASRFTERLDAAWRYQDEVMDLAERGNYNFAKHGSDWIDAQQVFYLCDPRIHFLTRDGGPKQRTVRSTQHDRVIEYHDVLSRAKRN